MEASSWRYITTATIEIFCYVMTVYGDRRFAVAAANCWNPLPNEVKNAESLASFRRQLKTHLFKQAFLI